MRLSSISASYTKLHDVFGSSLDFPRRRGDHLLRKLVIMIAKQSHTHKQYESRVTTVANKQSIVVNPRTKSQEILLACQAKQ
jgi:hypothetical protein